MAHLGPGVMAVAVPPPLLLPLPLLLLALGCSGDPAKAPLGRLRSAVELAGLGQVFAPATALTGERGPAARQREVAARATGALLAPFVDGTGAPLTAAGGTTRLRGICGVTFVAPSHAVTAAHCVDGALVDIDALVVEMYRPTPALADRFAAAAVLEGTFPDYRHPRLGAADGYLTDRYRCRVVSRCGSGSGSESGAPINCEGGGEADAALLRCDGAPGSKYGFLDVAADDDAGAEVFLPWKHEIYDVPLDPTDDRWQHYVAFPRDGDYGASYHYFGADGAGVEQNQLLPLTSVPFADGTPHHKLASTPLGGTTDLWGCHGTSGAGVLQPGARGAWQLLGPVTRGNAEHDDYLCNHVPSLDGFLRQPGSMGIVYQGVATTQLLIARNRDALAEDCHPLVPGAASLPTHLACPLESLRADPLGTSFAARLGAPSAAPVLDVLGGAVLALAAGESAGFTGFLVAAGEPYRLGLDAWSPSGCVAAPCPRLSVAADGREILSVTLDANPPVPVPVPVPVPAPLPAAALFRAERSGPITLTFRAEGAAFELGRIALRPEPRTNTFDTLTDRLEATLVDLASSPSPPQPMRFVGDGRDGFAAYLLGAERLVLGRQAIAPGRRWTARFTVSPLPASPPGAASLICGLLDGAGEVAVTADCSGGLVRLDDSGAAPPAARAAFFVETAPGAAPVTLDDLVLVSDAAPDSDGDGIPDAADRCPLGPRPAGEPLRAVLPESSTHRLCAPEPALLEVPRPRVANACDAPVIAGRLSHVNGRALGPRAVEVAAGAGAGQNGGQGGAQGGGGGDGGGARLLLPLGTHTVTWDIRDSAGNVHLTLAHTVTVVHAIGPECCPAALAPTTGTAARDTFISDGPSAMCVLAAGGDDLVAASGGGDRIWGGPGADYLAGRGGDDVLDGGDGNDYLAGGRGGALTVYAGAGDDTVHARFADSARIFAGPGADVLIGSEGPDAIFPGAGTLVVLAGGGDDTVTLHDACQLRAGLQLSGGDGNDTLVSPVPPDALALAGVTLEGFEEVIVDDSRGYLADCFGGP